MEFKTYPMKVAEGKVYAEITLRDVVERTKDLSDTPILAEIKRLYDENDKLRELCKGMWDFYCVMPYEPHEFEEELDFTVEVWKRMRELGIEVD